MIFEFNVGDRVHISSYRHSLKPKPGYGTVVHIFPAGESPDPHLILKYYGGTNTAKQYLRFCQTLKVDRYVVRRTDNESHLILPTPCLFLIRKIYDWKKEENTEEHRKTS